MITTLMGDYAQQVMSGGLGRLSFERLLVKPGRSIEHSPPVMLDPLAQELSRFSREHSHAWPPPGNRRSSVGADLVLQFPGSLPGVLRRSSHRP